MNRVALHSDNSLNVISLCTGGGGLDLGVELAIPDARSIVLVEREAFAVARLVAAMEEGLMAPAPVWSDVRTFNGRPWRGLVDGLIGGIPCQPHSVAGKRLGADDERDLWSDTRRIIVQSGTWFVLIENVQGMLSTGGAKRVWRDLRRLGFEVEIGLFTSAEVGAPHERTRVFILAMADPDRRHTPRRCSGCDETSGGRSRGKLAGSSKELADAGRERDAGLRERAGERPFGSAGRTMEHTASNGRGEGRTKHELRRGRDAASGDGCAMVSAIRLGHDGLAEDAIRRQIERNAPEWSERDYLPLYPPGPNNIDAWREIIERSPKFEPAVRRVDDGMAGRLDRIRMLGNGVNPLQAAYAVRTLATRLARRSAAAIRIVHMMDKCDFGGER